MHWYVCLPWTQCLKLRSNSTTTLHLHLQMHTISQHRLHCQATPTTTSTWDLLCHNFHAGQTIFNYSPHKSTGHPQLNPYKPLCCHELWENPSYQLDNKPLLFFKFGLVSTATQPFAQPHYVKSSPGTAQHHSIAPATRTGRNPTHQL